MVPRVGVLRLVVKAGSAGPAQLHRVMHWPECLCPTLKVGSAGSGRLSWFSTATASFEGGGYKYPLTPFHFILLAAHTYFETKTPLAFTHPHLLNSSASFG